MVRVGLTGGIACGKSTVGRMLEELGACVMEADRIAHELMRPGQPIYRDIVRHFGSAILGDDGTIDRARLAQAVFPTGRIEELNRLVHPAVIQRQEEWLEEKAHSKDCCVAVVEAALILEAGAGSRFDKLIVVTCRPEQKVERFAARQGLSLEQARAEVERRQAAQWPDERKMAAADYVIDNSGPLENSRGQVARVYEELNRLAKPS